MAGELGLAGLEAYYAISIVAFLTHVYDVGMFLLFRKPTVVMYYIENPPLALFYIIVQSCGIICLCFYVIVNSNCY